MRYSTEDELLQAFVDLLSIWILKPEALFVTYDLRRMMDLLVKADINPVLFLTFDGEIDYEGGHAGRVCVD